MSTDTADNRKTEGQLERLSQDLRDQMRMARDRIADRYAKLMEERSFEAPPKKQP